MLTISLILPLVVSNLSTNCRLLSFMTVSGALGRNYVQERASVTIDRLQSFIASAATINRFLTAAAYYATLRPADRRLA